jgi:WD40 repeat protein
VCFFICFLLGAYLCDLGSQDPPSTASTKATPPSHKLIASLSAAHGAHDVNSVVWNPRSGFEDLLATTGDDGCTRVWKVAPRS